MIDKDLERLLELESMKAESYRYTIWTNKEIKEFESLKSKLEEKLKHGKIREKQIEFWKEQGLSDIQAERFANNLDDSFLKSGYELEQENQKLKEENKRLESYYEKYCILQEHNDGFMHELEDAKSERDTLKEKLDRIKTCPFMTRCLDCGMSGVPKTRDDKECGNCNSMRTEIVIRELEILKELES